jgi:predicted HicB family RNase H-like nuclease
LNTTEAKSIQSEAKKLLKKGVTAPEFSRIFFGPEGRLRSLWSTPDERHQLVRSELYRWLQQELAGLRRQEIEAFEEEVKSLSGRVTIVIPKSLHAALKREAQSEGVSLSELMRLKLAVKYSQSTRRLSSKRKRVAQG